DIIRVEIVAVKILAVALAAAVTAVGSVFCPLFACGNQTECTCNAAGGRYGRKRLCQRLFLTPEDQRQYEKRDRLHHERNTYKKLRVFHSQILPNYAVYFFLDIIFKYSLIKSSISPSITAAILPVSQPVRLSLTRV